MKRLKQRLEVEAELERGVSPPADSKRTAESGETNMGTAPTAAADVARTVSSAEYVAGEIKRYKRGALLLAALVILAIGLAVGYYKYFGSRSQRITSVAVLPFTNASGDPNARLSI